MCAKFFVGFFSPMILNFGLIKSINIHSSQNLKYYTMINKSYAHSMETRIKIQKYTSRLLIASVSVPFLFKEACYIPQKIDNDKWNLKWTYDILFVYDIVSRNSWIIIIHREIYVSQSIHEKQWSNWYLLLSIEL